jgi:hypothetical protein
MVDIQVPGFELDETAEAEKPLAPGISVEVNAAVRVAPVGRGGRSVTIKAQLDDVVELQMGGGVILWLRADELEAKLGAAGARGRTGGAVVLGAELPLDDAARGIGSWAIDVLRVLGFNLPGKSARAIAEAFDQKAVRRPGLFRWDGKDGLEPFDKARAAADEALWLLFIHGTASSTRGSFGDLARMQPRTWQALEQHYGQRILAFEHHTLM